MFHAFKIKQAYSQVPNIRPHFITFSNPQILLQLLVYYFKEADCLKIPYFISFFG